MLTRGEEYVEQGTEAVEKRRIHRRFARAPRQDLWQDGVGVSLYAKRLERGRMPHLKSWSGCQMYALASNLVGNLAG